MQIYCNRPGGLGVGKVVLRFGVNEVPDQAWEEAASSANEAWLRAMLEPDQYGLAPIVLITDEPQVQESAKEKIERVNVAQSLAELDELAENETRKTVKAAIRRRSQQIGGPEIEADG